MSAIRGRNNLTTEGALVILLRKTGIKGWRRHADILGHPDFVFRKHMVAVFVDGCFWHGCPRCYKAPIRNVAYWRDKVQSNKARDRRVVRHLRKDGWKVVRIWEHEIAAATKVPKRLTAALGKASLAR